MKHEKLCVGPVAGVDEAGRGPLAGPVVAAAGRGAEVDGGEDEVAPGHHGSGHAEGEHEQYGPEPPPGACTRPLASRHRHIVRDRPRRR